MSSEILSTTITPAGAGFYWLWALYNSDPEDDVYVWVDKAPIIAWKITLREDDSIERDPVLAIPDVPTDYSETCFDLAVLAPDGTVYSYENSEQSTEEKWTAQAERYGAAKRKRECERAHRDEMSNAVREYVKAHGKDTARELYTRISGVKDLYECPADKIDDVLAAMNKAAA